MEQSTLYYQPVEATYLGHRHGWHEYKYVHFVADPKTFGGKSFAKAETRLRFVVRPGANSIAKSTILGSFNIQWYTILDNYGRDVVPPSFTWSHSDNIHIPSTLDEKELPSKVIPILGESFISRAKLRDKLEKIVSDDEENQSSELQQKVA